MERRQPGSLLIRPVIVRCRWATSGQPGSAGCAVTGGVARLFTGPSNAWLRAQEDRPRCRALSTKVPARVSRPRGVAHVDHACHHKRVEAPRVRGRARLRRASMRLVSADARRRASMCLVSADARGCEGRRCASCPSTRSSRSLARSENAIRNAAPRRHSDSRSRTGRKKIRRLATNLWHSRNRFGIFPPLTRRNRTGAVRGGRSDDRPRVRSRATQGGSPSRCRTKSR